MREKASHTLSDSNVGSSKSKVEQDKCSITTEEPSASKQVILSIDKMIENVNKTKSEIRQHNASVARSRLSLKRFRRDNKVTIDVNVNIEK